MAAKEVFTNSQEVSKNGWVGPSKENGLLFLWTRTSRGMCLFLIIKYFAVFHWDAELLGGCGIRMLMYQEADDSFSIVDAPGGRD